MKCSLHVLLKLLRGPLFVLSVGIFLASITASIDTFHGMDPEVLAFYGSVAGVYLLLNFWVGYRRSKA